MDVWLADLDAAGASIDALEARVGVCPPDERDRMRGFPDPEQGRRWMRSRVALRLLLATEMGLDRARAPFTIMPGGKPTLTPAGREFSLSHSGTYLLMAISRAGPVGLDIEARTSVCMDERRRVLIERAAAALAPHAPLPTSPSVRRFLQAWTRLEAVAKASGIGIGEILERFAIRGGRPAEAGLPEHVLVTGGQRLRVEDLTLPAAAVAAVALPQAAGLRLRAFPLSEKGIGELEAHALARG